MARPIRALVAVLLAVGWSALGLPAAATAAVAPAAGTGLVRVAHLSPDTPAVDFHVQSIADPGVGITLPGVDYGTVSAYQGLPTGTYAVSMRAAGADPATAPVLSTRVDVAEGSARTVAGLGSFADLGLTVLDDDLAQPPAGQARIRLIASASSADPLDVSLAGTTVATKLLPAHSSAYVAVPAGQASLRIDGGNGAPTDLPIDVAPGAVYTALVLDDGSGGLTVRTALDAAGPGVVPAGGVETGAGGTAGAGTAVLPVAVAGAAVVGLLLTALPWSGRRGTRRHPAS
jgi:Domain of unknown function (DUF4397)